MTRKMKPFARIFSALVWLCVLFVVSAGPALADRPGFNSPSGNIRCYLEDTYDGTMRLDERPFVCLIFEAAWTPPVDYGDDDPTCDLDRTRIIILPADGPATERWVCHGDVFFPIHGAISYGSEWSFLDFTCQVASAGISCQNSNGNGFSLRRADRTLF